MVQGQGLRVLFLENAFRQAGFGEAPGEGGGSCATLDGSQRSYKLFGNAETNGNSFRTPAENGAETVGTLGTAGKAARASAEPIVAWHFAQWRPDSVGAAGLTSPERVSSEDNNAGGLSDFKTLGSFSYLFWNLHHRLSFLILI